MLQTSRLRLRAHQLADFAACYAMWSDPVVTRFIGGKPSTEQQSWMRLMNYTGHWALMGFGYWLVEEKASGAFVGELGFSDFHREITPSIVGVPELGWALTPAMHGKGYAVEALTAAIAWGDAHLPSRRSVCIIDPANERSLKLAAKCGYHEWTRTTFSGGPAVMLARSAP